MRKTRLTAAAIGLALLASLATSQARADEPLKLRVAWAVIPGQLTAVLFDNKDILKHYGQSYVVDLQRFRGSTPELTALATGDLDLASLAFSSFGLAIQNAHMGDIRVVADLYQDGVPGYYSSEYMVRADSGIAKPEDLKGKTIATNAIGGAIDIASKAMLLQHGLAASPRTAPLWSISSRIGSARCTGSTIPRTATRRSRSSPISPRRIRANTPTGSSPRRTITAT
jgi:sulfonate transport system substrate-binding protein